MTEFFRRCKKSSPRTNSYWIYWIFLIFRWTATELYHYYFIVNLEWLIAFVRFSWRFRFFFRLISVIKFISPILCIPERYHKSPYYKKKRFSYLIGGAWKPSTHPNSLMKEPPISQMNRNGPTNYATQGQLQGAVMMVYGLDNDTSNTDKLFNLVCLYGNVARVYELISFISLW